MAQGERSTGPRGRDEQQRGPQIVPTASAALDDGRLLELVYDREQQRTAFAVFRDGTWHLERVVQSGRQRLVPFSAGNSLIRHNAVLLPTAPEEYGTTEELVAAIQAFIHRYVDVSPLFERVASYYVLLSWVYDAFNELPYLRIRGDYGSGKTRFLLTAGALCYRPFFASGASTVSPIFHTLDAFRGTLVIDEGDFRFSDEKADIVKILNNGHGRGIPILRTMVSTSGEYSPRAFHVFGPKIIATRGLFDDRALESRCITEELGGHRLRPDIPINLPPVYKEEALRLRNKLLLYRFRNLRRTQPLASHASSSIEPRLNQIFVPLLSVVESEEARRELKAAALRLQQQIATERGMGVEAQLLEVIRDLFDQTGSRGIAVGEIASALAKRYGEEFGHAVTSKWVGALIRKRLFLRTYKSHGVFLVPASEKGRLELLYERYGLMPDRSANGSTGAEPAQEADRIG